MCTICEIELFANAPKPKGYPTNPQTYGEHLKKARFDLDLTQGELARILEVYTSTIDKWERQKIKPNINNREGIISFLGYYPEIKK